MSEGKERMSYWVRTPVFICVHWFCGHLQLKLRIMRGYCSIVRGGGAGPRVSRTSTRHRTRVVTHSHVLHSFLRLHRCCSWLVKFCTVSYKPLSQKSMSLPYTQFHEANVLENPDYMYFISLRYTCISSVSVGSGQGSIYAA